MMLHEGYGGSDTFPGHSGVPAVLSDHSLECLYSLESPA